MVRSDQIRPTETEEYEQFLREKEIKGAFAI